MRHHLSMQDLPPTASGSNPVHRGQDGFSLVEVVVAMMLFAVIAVGILPLIMGVTQLTVLNSDVVRAKAGIQQKLSTLQAAYPTDPAIPVAGKPAGKTNDCAAVLGSNQETIDSTLTLHTKSDATCPSVYPGTLAFKFTVVDASGNVVATSYSSVRVTQ